MRLAIQAILWASAMLVACSADVVIEGEGGGGSGGRSEVPPPPDVNPIAACPRLLVVPEGDAYIGFFEVSSDHEVTGVTCDDPVWPTLPAAKRLSVPGFYLDEDEVTNACYAYCVNEGACAAPPQHDGEAKWDGAEVANFPVSATFETAQAYCAWRGGRLPSSAELARASHGDAANVTNEVEFERMVSCWQETGADDSTCELIRSLAYVEQHPHAIRTDDADVGPFGHWDLFASRCDVTQSRFPTGDEERKAFCALPDGSLDAKTYGSGYAAGFCPAQSMLKAFPGSSLDNVFTSSLSLGSTPGVDVFVDGVRCAFDPVSK